MGAKIAIVDESDNVIGEKYREEVQTEDIYRVSALWITNNKGDILLAKRALTKKHDPGKWGPAVAGTVDSGETYKDNIKKEAEEELGLTDINPILGAKERVKGIHNYFVQRYFLTLDKDVSDFKIQKDEVAEIKWFPKKILEKELSENPEKFLKRVQQWKELF